MWTALSEFDFETVKSCLHPDVHYENVPTEDAGAIGPENLVARLSVACDHIREQIQTTYDPSYRRRWRCRFSRPHGEVDFQADFMTWVTSSLCERARLLESGLRPPLGRQAVVENLIMPTSRALSA
jgi:hypothetical protein